MGWRTTIRTNAKQKVLDYSTANPTVLRQVYRTRPASFPTVPCAYVGDIRTQSEADSGTRRTSAEVDIVLVTSNVINDEADAELDTIADALDLSFINDPHVFGSNTVQEPVRSTTVDISVGDVAYHGLILTLGKVLIDEGRV